MNERKKSGIYIIRNVVNGNCYVGQAKSIGDRWYTHRSHLRCGYHHSRHLQSAWRKYGPDSFIFEVLEYVPLDKQLLFEREQYWFDTLNPEYNLAPAAVSCLGIKHPPRSTKHRKRMSERMKGRKPSAETIEKLRAAQKANPYRPTKEHREKLRIANTGKLRSLKSIEKWRAKVIGRKQGPEEIARRVASVTGLKRTPEQRARISEAKIRLKHGVGVKQSQQTIEKRAASLRGRKRPIEVMSIAHDALAAKRKPITDKIKAALTADINLNATHLAAELNCSRATIRKYKRELRCQLQQQNDSANVAPNLPKKKARSFTLPYRQPQQLSLPLG